MKDPKKWTANGEVDWGGGGRHWLHRHHVGCNHITGLLATLINSRVGDLVKFDLQTTR